MPPPKKTHTSAQYTSAPPLRKVLCLFAKKVSCLIQKSHPLSQEAPPILKKPHPLAKEIPSLL